MMASLNTQFSLYAQHSTFYTIRMTISPTIPLRLGLGVMYVYSGIDLIRNPDNWIAFIPGWLMDALTPFIALETFLRVQGVAELVFAFVFLALFLPNGLVRIIALCSALEMLSILALTGVDLITFRDFGLLGASVTLILLLAPPAEIISAPVSQEVQ